MTYGELTAVASLSFEAYPGRILAILGPNGAGKTSTIEALEGYRRPSGGEVRVLGLDPAGDSRRLAPRIGVMLQEGGVYPSMTPQQVIRLFSGYYRRSCDPDRVLGEAGLTAAARTPYRRLSGGERQRLSLALALLPNPDVAFLDEPTAGVDPEGRLAIRGLLEELRESGACVILTTHELAEAERLADEVLILARGRCVMRGTLKEILAASPDGPVPARLRTSVRIDADELCRHLGEAPGWVVEEASCTYELRVAPSPDQLAAMTAYLAAENVAIEALDTGARNLEDAYLQVVRGERLEER